MWTFLLLKALGGAASLFVRRSPHEESVKITVLGDERHGS
jgi:hypothetical protein